PFTLSLLLPGRPGIAKPTVLRAPAPPLAALHLVGFYTAEIREHRERLGFRPVTFTGEPPVIAHIRLPPPRVSKYGVDLAAIDRFATCDADDARHAARSDCRVGSRAIRDS